MLCLGVAYSRPATKHDQAAASSSSKKSSNSASKKSSRSSKKGSTAAKGGATAKGKQSANQSGGISRSASSRTKKGAARASPVPRGQQAPTPDRVKEIQKALIDRGYLHGGPTGVWGQDSVDALRRFQEEKNIMANGKLSSLSLIHLGLGPKRDTPAQPQRTEQQQ